MLDDKARVNVTISGQFGELPDPVSFDAPDPDLKGWINEALRTGGIPGIALMSDADLTDFVVERFEATDARPFRVISLRPKTPFGS